MPGLFYVDTHCHLEQEEFDQDRDLVVMKAKELGIAIITSGIEESLWEKACSIAESYPNVYASIGLDPTQFGICDKALQWIKSNSNRIIAIGETGLDHYLVRDHKDRDRQKLCFKKMIGLADSLKVPIQVHSRSAGKKALGALSENSARDVHLHAFDGKASLARTASRDLGYYFSIPTSVARSPQKRRLVKAIHIERLLIETDSPLLGAEKGVRNVPANIPIALKEVASILGREEEEIREVVLENTLRLYTNIQMNS